MPKAEITLHIYSGREDPKWTIDDAHPHFGEIVKYLGALNHNQEFEHCLGYRGFTVRHGHSLYHIPKSTNITLEKLLLETEEGEYDNTSQSKKHLLSDSVRAHVLSHLDVVGKQDIQLPPFEPAKWNTPTVQPNNNCYNYANNIITNSFAQPGRQSGQTLNPGNGESVKRCAVSDGLVTINVNPTNPVPTTVRNLVALVIWPNEDFHWYRLDDSLSFSHKAGETKARDTDEKGKKIDDPRTANRGPYTEFTTFMKTDPNIVKIK